MRRVALFVCALALGGCAEALDLEATFIVGGGGDSGGVDTAVGVDSAVVDSNLDSASPVDSAVPDTATVDEDTSPADTGSPVDSGSVDTGKADTGTVVTDGGGCAVQGCLKDSADRLTCGTARIIARRTAGPLGGYIATGISLLTAAAATKITDGNITCPAYGPDHAYRLFMRKGETTTVTLAATTSGVNLSTLFWESSDCTTNVCAGTSFKCGSSTGGSYTAAADGWVTILIAGQLPVDIDSYDLEVTLTGCKSADCECPP